MKVVVDIPNWLYNAIMERKEPHYSKSLGEAVRDGTPLPKGYGDLIEKPSLIDELAISEEPDGCRGCVSYNSYDDFCCRSLDFQNMCRSIRTAPVVIPADREVG